MTLSVRRVEGMAALEALRDPWNLLVDGTAQPSPFLSHEWFLCCARAVRPDAAIEILVVEDGQEVVGLVPLMRWTDRIRGLPVRALGFLAAPDTPMTGMVAAGPLLPVVQAMLDHLLARRDWDVLRLRKLQSGEGSLAAWQAALPGRCAWRSAPPLGSPYLTVDGNWKTFYSSTTQRFKKTARNIRNRLDRAGRVSIEEHRAMDPDSAAFAELLDLSARSWKGERQLAIATMPGMRSFFAELTRRASAREWLSVWILRLNGRAIAMEYQIVGGGTAHALRADFDPAFHELSPGSALNHAIAEALFARSDVREYDMGPGVNDYKLRWATGIRETIALTAFRPGPYGRTLAAVEMALVPTARRVLQALR